MIENAADSPLKILLDMDDNSIKLVHVKKQTPKRWTCKRCDSTWESRITTKPIQCPRCKSPFWDSPRKREAAFA